MISNKVIIYILVGVTAMGWLLVDLGNKTMIFDIIGKYIDFGML